MNNELLPKAIELRHRLHQYPELAMQETETRRILKEYISNNCHNIQLIDKGCWFYCVKKGTGTHKIAFRADYDALPIDEYLDLPYHSHNPGVSHKCGHDGHSAALAYLITQIDDQETDKTVYFIFQPAEETGQGGRLCSELLAEEEIEEVYSWHNLPGYPKGQLIYRKGLSQPASVGITINVKGKTSHASDPEHGINPSQMIADVISFINDIPKQSHKGMVLCTIVNVEIGTKDFGISAGEGEISFTLRAENEDELQMTKQMIIDYANRKADESKLRMSYQENDYFPETRNDDECLQKVVNAAESCGITVQPMKELWRASEDFGTYLKSCPGAIFYLGAGIDAPPLHTREYDFCDELIKEAASVFRKLIEMS